MDIILTKDSETLICHIYKAYLEKRKSGIPKSDANYFESSEVIHRELLPEWLFEDVDDTCRELSRAKLICCKWGDDISIDIKISDLGISYMENRFKNGLAGVIDFITKFIP